MKLSTFGQGHVTVVAPRDAIVQAECDSLGRAVEQACAEGTGWVVLDLTDVPFIDSAGLELMVRLAQVCASRRGRLKLAGLTDVCTEILRVTDLDGHFEVYETAKGAAATVVEP